MGRSGPMPHLSEDLPEVGSPAGLSRWHLDDALASEYVLDVLNPDERGEAEARIRSEPGFAAMVAKWQTLMADRLSERPIPTPSRHRTAKGSGFPRLYSVRTETLRQGGRFIRDAFRFLAGMTLAAILVMATVALVALPRPGVIAMLAAPDNRLAYEISEYGAALKITRVAGLGASGEMVHELWLMVPGEGPVSIGFLDEETLVVDRPVPPPGSRFAVTLERKGGGLGGRPSGPMILVANVDL